MCKSRKFPTPRCPGFESGGTAGELCVGRRLVSVTGHGLLSVDVQAKSVQDLEAHGRISLRTHPGEEEGVPAAPAQREAQVKWMATLRQLGQKEKAEVRGVLQSSGMPAASAKAKTMMNKTRVA